MLEMKLEREAGRATVCSQGPPTGDLNIERDMIQLVFLKDHSGLPVEKGLKWNSREEEEASWEPLRKSRWEMKTL